MWWIPPQAGSRLYFSSDSSSLLLRLPLSLSSLLHLLIPQRLGGAAAGARAGARAAAAAARRRAPRGEHRVRSLSSVSSVPSRHSLSSVRGGRGAPLAAAAAPLAARRRGSASGPAARSPTAAATSSAAGGAAALATSAGPDQIQVFFSFFSLHTNFF